MQALQPRSRNLERFGLVRVRSPLLTESRLISFPTGTEMCQVPALAPFRVLHVAVGCPIRRSSVRRVLARSPRLIAGSCVLHRLLLPRHPPHALCSYSPVRSLGPGPRSREIQDLENLALGHISRPDRSPGREIDTAFTTIRMRTEKDRHLSRGEEPPLVEAIGIEPTTSCVQSRCSPS